MASEVPRARATARPATPPSHPGQVLPVGHGPEWSRSRQGGLPRSNSMAMVEWSGQRTDCGNRHARSAICLSLPHLARPATRGTWRQSNGRRAHGYTSSKSRPQPRLLPLPGADAGQPPPPGDHSKDPGETDGCPGQAWGQQVPGRHPYVGPRPRSTLWSPPCVLCG